MTKELLPNFLRFLVIGLASNSFPHAQAQAVDAFLENSTLKIGLNAGSYGGAIMWFSGSNGANLVNTYDKGREIQQSFYAGGSITAANQSPTWNPSPNTTIYHVKRAPGSGGPYTLIASGAATEFTDVGLTNGVRYNYVVSPKNPVGQGADSPVASAAANMTILVPDAGFENPTTSTYQYHPTGSSWTFNDGSGISTNTSAFTYANPPAPEGLQVAFLQGVDAAISTQLNGLTPGAEYLLIFSAAQRAGYTGQTWNASIDGSVIGSFAPPNTATNYQDYTATFTASATSSLLAFVGTNLNGGDNTVFIDNVRVVQIAAADPFGSWMTTSFPEIEAPDNAPTADPDNDGIANLLEYIQQGGDPSVFHTGILPTLDASGENFIFTYFRRAAATGVSQTFEYGTTLSGWTPVAIPGGSGVTITPDTPGAGIDKVELSVVIGTNTKLFGRLKVAQP